MRTITLQDVEPDLAEALEKEAQARGKSISETAKELLAGELERLRIRKDDFRDLIGKWTQEQYEEFERNTADLRQIDPEDWE